MKRQKKKKEGKVRNATPTEYDGIKFRSKLEMYTYKKLREARINVDYEQHRFELLPAFVALSGKKYRAMTYLPDFVGKNFIIECKGYCTDTWPLRKKLFEYALMRDNLNYDFYEVHTQKEVDTLVLNLKEKNYV